MARIEYTLPAGVAPQQRAEFGVYRPGVAITDFDSGFRSTRTWSEYAVRVYTWTPEYLKASETVLSEFDAFLQHVGLAGTPFWIVEPISRAHRGLLCGPLATGSRTTFPLPINGTATNVVVFQDGVPQSSSTYTVHGSANIIGNDTGGDEHAECDDPTKFTTTNATDAAAKFGIEGLGCLELTPNGSGNPNVYPIAYGAVTQNEYYTAIAAFLEGKASPRTARCRLYWYNSSKTYQSADSATAANLTTGEWRIFHHTAAAATGTGTGFARPVAEVVDTNTTVWHADAMALCPGDYDRWHLPSQAPNLIEFDTAPADGVRITAAATGKRMARVRLDDSEMIWEMISPGHALPSKMVLIEEIEVNW